MASRLGSLKLMPPDGGSSVWKLATTIGDCDAISDLEISSDFVFSGFLMRRLRWRRYRSEAVVLKTDLGNSV
ncbi:hypothetical protein L484_003983 [Morus notabilis]|uniref:Uncharacterized protein n=1 Tax=Morus notabilis TaxID=981085 RepID=W9QPU2_9ROSA|nr:hypothetical protein L484_003983 [Morus notabilis]